MFHTQEGLHFDRQENGDVKVILTNNKAGIEQRKVLFETTLSPDCWASVVSSMCIEGETGRTFRMAHVFHDGRG